MHFLLITLLIFFVISTNPTAAKPTDVSCHECVHYNFEQDFNSLFNSNGSCAGLPSWSEGRYSSAGIDSPTEYSQTFIKPEPGSKSCTASFPFTMVNGGTINVRVYIDSANASFPDNVLISAQQLQQNGNIRLYGKAFISSSNPETVNGWNTVTFTVYGPATFEAHLAFLGTKYPGSVILVDSFCHKPANYEGECWVHDYLTTTSAQPETTATEIGTTTEVVEISSSTSVTDSPSVTESTIYETEATALPEITSTTSVPSIIVPLPTLPTPAPGLERRCPDDPFIHWLLPHENNCNLFYYCVWGQKVQRECPSGLHFNPDFQVCDWPLNAGCTTK